ncbi:MAG TPA: tRNA (N6-isopentenyl adenosine(37)-C2)-methylthiotransferase MiaB, partial [Candidatus Parcubacteria bacterium]|nr:tRNA (N6-isopentenyl adenosine(37)-C2)-methylthiotransferase MiaB [Candidatus Parcubacteria bacterium]
LIVINMCSVRQSAVDRVHGQLNKIKKDKKKKPKVILTGCILEKDKIKFKKTADFVLPIKSLPNWPKIINKQKIKETELTPTKNYLDIEPKYKDKFSTFIPISNGCNNACTYCAVPYTRGPLVCRSHKKIIEEVKKVIKNGAKEIWLLGQNVNDYASPSQPSIDFPELLKKINKIPGNFWIRFTSPNPADFNDKLINVISQSQKITPYLNLPVQSGDNEILKKMNRRYTVEQYKNLVKKLRKKIPDICLSTDIIVGFPSETKKQFENTKKLMKEIKFDMAYVAQYSPRPGTTAARMKDNVPKEEKKKREKILTEVLKKTALENNKKYIKKTEKTLVLKEKGGFLIGKTIHFKTIKFKGDKKLIGKFVNVRITNALSWGLKGEIAK